MTQVDQKYYLVKFSKGEYIIPDIIKNNNRLKIKRAFYDGKWQSCVIIAESSK